MIVYLPSNVLSLNVGESNEKNTVIRREKTVFSGVATDFSAFGLDVVI